MPVLAVVAVAVGSIAVEGGVEALEDGFGVGVGLLEAGLRYRRMISMNWRGRPLVSYRTIIELISATTTTTGLTIRAAADTNHYEKGTKVTDAQLAAVPLTAHQFHGDWHHTIASSNPR